LTKPLTSLLANFIDKTAPDILGFPEVSSLPVSSMAEIEFELPIATNSSAKVSAIVEGKISIVEFTAGSALTKAVCAEAGGATKESAKNPAITRNLENFTLEVYPW